MEGNVHESNSNQLDEDVRPPPRKRLLAGFKKQNGSEQSAYPPTPTTPNEVDARIKNLLSSSKCTGRGSSSLEEITESSKKAALVAADVAKSARAAAQEKAFFAAKAIASAKNALNLVASFCEETSRRNRHSRRKNSNQNEVKNGKTDETGHKLHRVTQSSVMNSPTSSYSKTRNHKKPNYPNGKATFKNEDSSSTKLISSNWRIEKDIVTQKRKARKQLNSMVERQVDSSIRSSND